MIKNLLTDVGKFILVCIVVGIPLVALVDSTIHNDTIEFILGGAIGVLCVFISTLWRYRD